MTSTSSSNDNLLKAKAALEAALALKARYPVLIEAKAIAVEAARRSAAQRHAAQGGEGPIESGELAALRADMLVLEQADADSRIAVADAEQNLAECLTDMRLNAANAVLDELTTKSVEIGATLLRLARQLTEYTAITRRVIPLTRRPRGVDAAGPDGFLVFDKEQLTMSHAQRLVEIDLTGLVAGWRYEMAPPRCFRFDDGVRGLCSNLRMELDLLVGSGAKADPVTLLAQARELAEQQSAQGA